MPALSRYARLWLALARYSLIRELSFRGNFLIKVTVEVLWLAILLVFYRAVFAQTNQVESWTEPQYFFYVGCYFALLSVLESLFLSNCGEFAELIRTGNLDFYLLKPIDEQFLVSCRDIEWSGAPSILMGVGVMIFALVQMEWQFDLLLVLAFLLVFVSGCAITYGFLLILTSLSVWLTRNQSLYEVWWLFTSLMRYPKEIFVGWAYPIGFVFSFLIPVNRRQRACRDHGEAGAQPVVHRVHRGGRGGAAVAQPPCLSRRTAPLPQRQQLSGEW
jgi:ABC-2 type transport system permease protein